MLSRVADSIFWMSRYVERAENVSRFINVNLHLSLDMRSDIRDQWMPLVYTTGDHAAFCDRYSTADQESVLRFLTFDAENPNSILSCLSSARENARTAREMLSSRTWEELNKFYLMVRQAACDMAAVLESPFEFFERIRQAAALLEGVTEGTMSRGEAWHFRRLGRMLERCDKTSRILDVKYFLLLPSVQDVGTPLDTMQWASLLKTIGALEMYRQTHGRITPEKVVAFLVLDGNFPRAIRFCLNRGEQSLLAITGGTPGTYRNIAEQRLGRLRSELDYTSIGDIIGGGLHEFIDGFQARLNRVGESMNETFFANRRASVVQQRPESDSTQSQRQHAVA